MAVTLSRALQRMLANLLREIALAKKTLGGFTVYGTLIWLLLAGAIGKLAADRELMLTIGQTLRVAGSEGRGYQESISYRRFNRQLSPPRTPVMSPPPP